MLALLEPSPLNFSEGRFREEDLLRWDRRNFSLHVGSSPGFIHVCQILRCSGIIMYSVEPFLHVYTI